MVVQRCLLSSKAEMLFFGVGTAFDPKWSWAFAWAREVDWSVGCVYETRAENRRGRIGKPGLFLETGIAICCLADPRPDRVTKLVTLPVGHAS
jgi:hypothetical protein